MTIWQPLFSWLKKNSYPAPPDSLKEALAVSRFYALKQNVKEALQFLRKKHKKNVLNTRQLPWYLVFGAENSGKTTLLASSNLGFVSTNNHPVHHISNTVYCQWFFGQDAVFIDVSGSLLLPEYIETTDLNLWKRFIALLHQHKPSHRLDGLILAIDFWNFQNKTLAQQTHYIDTLRHHIQSFSYPIPLYVVLTYCDQLVGFTDFFQLLHNEERDQICGVSLPVVDQQNFAAYLEEQINAFLLRLNGQILTFLHRERHLENRIAIKNFPLQLEACKKILIHLCNQLHNAKNPIKGIYLTSCQQGNLQNDALSSVLNTFNLPIKPNNLNRPLRKNVFFVKGALKKIIDNQNNDILIQKTIYQKIFNHPHFLIYVSGFFLGIIALFFTNYLYNRHAINAVHAVLSEYENQLSNNLAGNSFTLLNILKKGEDQLIYANNPLIGSIFPQARRLKLQLNTLYDTALDNTFTPMMEKQLTQQLTSEIQDKAPSLYNTLKIYFMLDNPSHRDLTFIQNWFNLQLDNKGSKNKQLFLQHLTTWIGQPSFSLKLDPKLISLAKTTLNALSPTDIVYANLEEDYRTRFYKSNKATNTINPFYSAKNFQTIYQHDIQAACEQMLKDNAWMLAETSSANLFNALIPQLVEDVQQIYLTHYIDFWSARSSKLTVPVFHDLKEARLFAETFASDRSVMLLPLEIIETNLEPIATTIEGQKALSTLQKTRNILINNALDDKTKDALKGLADYLDAMLKSDNVENAIFTAASNRMQNSPDKDAINRLIQAATTAPAPIAPWLNQLATNTWQTMLNTSQQHLNTLWVQKVLPQYKAEILNRYPVFKDAKTDIALKDFSAFFGINGTIDSFVKENLAAFVDNSTLYWKWKEVNGLTINIPQNTLEMLNRAAIIRKMYFSNKEKTMMVKFSITPNNLELIADNLILTINGQSVDYTTDFRQAQSMQWPNNQPGYASLEIKNSDKKQILYEEKGDWALFRLLAHAGLRTANNLKNYNLIFNVNKMAVSYELLADTPINAFTPSILTAFRCPESLRNI
jgi:type VI protein secretion system component VasK